ncbi:DUF7684 family protein [Mucilaginibacter gilvus]|uniref:DUF7684 domain-containing protein n=1 Tax=Mucilaginibacter gilvus TaxID=2305909 RepID=A0A3S3YP62_9SPHI|nr:hypothetical protein [Mucilaginibacter gilvus]RWY47215.1 hypothetical protein EPL05_22280 [Mucilaginibacter gilvus]
MIHLTTVNNRKVLYQRYSTELPWSKYFPTQNWLAFVVVKNQAKTKLIEISNKLINNNACFICSSGVQGELLHDIIDEEIMFRQVDIDDLYLPPFDIVTTWHNDIAEGLWYATKAACNDPTKIDKVVCLDASESGIEPEILELLLKFNAGYIPD